MQTENIQQQQPADIRQHEAPPISSSHDTEPQTYHDPIMQQLAAQQATINQMVVDQQAMWQHLQAALPQQGNPGGHTADEAQSTSDHSENCEHQKDPAEQAEHFVRMAEKFSRGEVDMDSVAGGLSYLNSQSSSFWKGILIGGGLTLLVGNETIRNSITDVLTHSAEEKSE